MSDDVLRLHYQERQYLGAGDFDDEQTYLIDSRRRNNISGRTWGILSGLDLSLDTATNVCVVKAGVMIDAYGRETYVFQDTAVEIDPSTPIGSLKVWLAYATEDTVPAAAGYLTCQDAALNTRTRESSRIVVQDAPPPFNSQLPDDTAHWPVANQDLSDDPFDQPWPVRLGTVTWDGTKVTAVDGAGRRYSGLRGAEVVAQTPQLDVRPARLRLTVTDHEDAVITTHDPSPLHLRTNDDSGGGGIVIDHDDVAMKKTLTVEQKATLKDTVGNGAGQLVLETQGSTPATLTCRNGGGSSDLAIRTNSGAGNNRVLIDKDAVTLQSATITGPLDLQGGAVLQGGFDSWGPIVLKNADGTDGSDPMVISRAGLSNQNTLRLQIGDDLDGQDRLAVGPVWWSDLQFKEQFTVDNLGNVTARGNAQIDGLVNNRSMLNDGQKLDTISWSAKEVAVITGFIGDGQPVPLPSGFAPAQCVLFVSPAFGVVSTTLLPLLSLTFTCNVLANGTLNAKWFLGNSGPIPGTAQYLSIGIR